MSYSDLGLGASDRTCIGSARKSFTHRQAQKSCKVPVTNGLIIQLDRCTDTFISNTWERQDTPKRRDKQNKGALGDTSSEQLYGTGEIGIES